MLIIVGSLVVVLSMIGGFMIAGGNPLVLLHISAFVVILVIAGVVLITASPKSVLMRIIADTKACLTNKGATEVDFLDLMKLLYVNIHARTQERINCFRQACYGSAREQHFDEVP